MDPGVRSVTHISCPSGGQSEPAPASKQPRLTSPFDPRQQQSAEKVFLREIIVDAVTANKQGDLFEGLKRPFKKYLYTSIIKHGLHKDIPRENQADLLLALRYIFGIFTQGKDYRVSIPDISASSAFTILCELEEFVSNNALDLKQIIADHMNTLVQDIENWDLTKSEHLNKITQNEIIKLIQHANPTFKLDDYIETNGEGTQITGIHWAELNQTMQQAFTHYMGDPSVAQLSYLDAYENPNKVVEYLTSDDPYQVSRAIDLLFVLTESFKGASPIVALEVISQNDEEHVWSRISEALGKHDLRSAFKKIQRIKDRIDAFRRSLQASSEGVPTHRGLDEYFKCKEAITSAQSVQQVDAKKLFVQLMGSHASLIIFKKMIPKNCRFSYDFNRCCIDLKYHPQADSIISWLFKNTDINLGAKDSSGDILVHSAVIWGHLEVLRALIAADADLNAKNGGGITPAHIASARGHIEVLRALIAAGVDLEAKNGRGMTPAHIASARGHMEVLQVLIAAGVDLEAKDDRGMTPVHIAVSLGNIEVLKVLIAAGANVNAKDDKGMTPAHILAIKKGEIAALLQLLIDAGADLNAKDDSGMTPMHIAVSRSHIVALKGFIAAGANVNAKDNSGTTPAHIVVMKNEEIAKALLQLLIDAGADLNAGNNDGITPVDLAALRQIE